MELMQHIHAQRQVGHGRVRRARPASQHRAFVDLMRHGAGKDQRGNIVRRDAARERYLGKSVAIDRQTFAVLEVTLGRHVRRIGFEAHDHFRHVAPHRGA